MLTDFHNHFLPQIDDGAETVAVSARMCQYSFAQGIKRIMATPHFRTDTQTITEFLRSRGNAYTAYKKMCPLTASQVIIQLGAEVALTEGVSLLIDLDKLTLARSKYIMIELPVFGYEKWIDAELNCIMYRNKLIPVFSNIERYELFYPKDVFERLLHTPKALFQINTRSMLNKSTGLIIKKLLDNNQRILFGTNAHNMNSRAPEWTVARERLNELLGETRYNILVLQNNAFLNPKLTVK